MDSCYNINMYKCRSAFVGIRLRIPSCNYFRKLIRTVWNGACYYIWYIKYLSRRGLNEQNTF